MNKELLVIKGNKKERILNILSYFLIFLILASSFSIFHYTDYSDTLDNSVMLAESIKEGKLTSYYTYAAENANLDTVYTANYNVFLYGIFMLWNLPTVILHLCNGFDYMNSTFALLWCKALILVCIFVVSYLIKKIISLYVKDTKIVGLIQKLFLAGSCVIIPAMVACQYDILSLVFILLGLYGFLKGKNKLFLISFMLAIPLKTFAVFIFIPLLLLKEKRIPFIVLNLAIVMAINFLCQIPFLHDEWYNICMSTQNRDAIKLIIDSSILTNNFSLNVFVILFVTTCIYAYIVKKEDELYLYKTIYIAGASISSFIIFTSIRSYWIILMIPFVLMVLLFNRKYFRVNMILYIIGTACYSIYSLMNHWIYSHERIISKLLLHKFIEIPEPPFLKYDGVYGLLSKFDLIKYSPIIYTIFAVSIIAIFLLNYPKSKKFEDREYKYESWFVLWQLVITSGLIVLLLYSNLVQGRKPAYSIHTFNKIYMEENIFTECNIKQTFKVLEDNEVHEIKLRTKNIRNYREKRNAIRIVIREHDIIMVDKTIGVACIEDREDYSVDFDTIKLEAGKEYTLEISPVITREQEDKFTYFEVTDSLVYNDYPMYINDVPQERNLVFTLR